MPYNGKLGTTRLSDVIDAYLVARVSEGKAKATLANDRSVTDRLLEFVGNIQIRYVDDSKVDDFLGDRATRVSPGTLNQNLAHLRTFFQFCSRRNYIGKNDDPVGHRKQLRYVPPLKTRIPVERFGELLDSATHPRDRVVIALGLLTLARQGEITALQWKHVDLDNREIQLTRFKTKQRVALPMDNDLYVELMAWRTFWFRDLGQPPHPEDFVACKKSRPQSVQDSTTGRYVYQVGAGHLLPGAPVITPWRIMQRAMSSLGIDTRDDNGRAKGEGMHTLRRSAARARYDHMVEHGYDGALENVRALLGHASVMMTERYIGLDLDMKKLHDSVKGTSMFGTPIQSKGDATVTNITEKKAN